MIDRALSIRAAADEAGDRPFLVESEGTTLTHAQACSACTVATAASRFSAPTADPTREVILEILGALEARTPLVPLHPRWTPAERAHALAQVSSSDRLSDEILAVLFTSGTTGRPKGALLSRRAFVAAASASAERLGWRDHDRWLLAMPLAHVGGLSVLVRTLIARRTVVLGPSGPFDAQRTLEVIASRAVTLLSLVPTQLARLVALDASPPPSVRAVLLGGAACPPSVLERAVTLGWPLHTTYGLTEACSQVTTAEAPVRSMTEGCGRPLRGVEVRVRDGRIAVRSPFAMSGWLDASLPDPFDAEGFYDTSDLGELDAEGRLHVHARREDLIVTGGENVYPAEVERALLAIDGITDACVVGLPDDTWGQRVAAAIVCPVELTNEMILEEVSKTLARFKVPRVLVRLTALPMSASGKIDRSAVRRALG